MASWLVPGLTLLVLTGIWVLFLRRFQNLRGEMGSPPDFLDIPWTPGDLALLALTFFAFSGMAGLVLTSGRTEGVEVSAWSHALGFLVTGAGAAAVLILLMTLRKIRFGHFGLELEGVGKPIAFGLAAYGVFVPGVFLSRVIWAKFLEMFGFQVEPQEVVTVLLEKVRPTDGQPADVLLIAVFVFSTVILVPIYEEFLFRGLLLGGFRRWMPAVPAVFLSSWVFALVHTTSTFGPILVLSLIMGGVYTRTRSLPATIAIHSAHNGFMVMGLFLSPI